MQLKEYTEVTRRAVYKHKDTLANNHMKNYEENKKWTCIKQQGMTCVKGSSNGRGISDIEKGERNISTI